MKPRLSPRLRFALLWPILAAAAVAAPLLWFVVTGPLEEGTATLLLDTVEILWPQAALAAAQEPVRAHEAIRNLGAASAIRITLIAEDGEVVAESTLTWDEVREMDNHGTRPEVRQAFAAGQGTAVRRSTTTGRHYAYAAKTFVDADGRRYILRLARPLEQVTLLRRNLAGTLLLAVASALVVLGPVSWWLNRELFRPLKTIIAGAARLAAGELASRVAVPEAEELGTLADSLNRLAGEVEAQIALLAAERNELREILANMSEGVLVTDPEGRVRRVNDAFKRLFDLSAELAGRPVAEIGPEVEDLVAAALREGEPQCAELELKEPRRRILGLVGSPLPDRHGAVVAARDMTETLRLAEIRKDLVANVSHELKTPLTAIRGYAETLEDGALGDAEVASGFVRRILEQCARLEALLRDLLTLSRLESRRGPDGRPPRDREAVDLGELARRAVEVLATQARTREVELSLDAAAPLPAVDGDREELERLLLNLVENAVKYNRPGGEVGVRLLADGAEVVIEVRDTGIGIPDDARSRIFERFYRVDKGRSRDQGGTGLGLSIVKHAARTHGGRVEVESRLGVGSVFRVRLPHALAS